jgi:hypothetical protein
MLAAGSRLGDDVIVAKLGDCGTGEVYVLAMSGLDATSR